MTCVKSIYQIWLMDNDSSSQKCCFTTITTILAQTIKIRHYDLMQNQLLSTDANYRKIGPMALEMRELNDKERFI